MNDAFLTAWHDHRVAQDPNVPVRHLVHGHHGCMPGQAEVAKSSHISPLEIDSEHDNGNEQEREATPNQQGYADR